MPTCFSATPNLLFKSCKLLIITLLAPAYLLAQQTLTGLWIGVVSNDSNTVRKEQSFEIALSEYNGRVSGYSRSEFIVNDTLYYIVKRVKGKINGDVCEVTDDEILAYNFPGRLDKGVKVTSTFYRSRTDSNWTLAGGWKTNQTKRFYAVTGKLALSEEKDLTASRLFPHLEELGFASDLAFYRDRNKTEAVMKTVQSEEQLFSSIRNEKQTSIQPMTVTRPTDQVQVTTVDVTYTTPIGVNAETTRATSLGIPVKTESEPIMAQLNAEPVREKTSIQPEILDSQPPQAIDQPRQKNVKVNTAKVTPTQIGTTRDTEPKPENRAVVQTKTQTTIDQPTVSTNRSITEEKAENRTLLQTKTQTTTGQPTVSTNGTVTKKVSPSTTQPSRTETTKPVATVSTPVPVSNTRPDSMVTAQRKTLKPEKSVEEITAPAKMIGGRTSEFAQTVYFKSDSLLLSLYDNGEIDGDTVSVFMNGTTLLSKQGLRASAIRKTIYLPPGGVDEFTLVLFADNLGKYPPNTGLLVVRDGEDIYNVRFSADYQKNAGVVFRRQQ